MDNKKWINYFDNISNKYNLKMNKNNTIVIFIDGKDITKSSKHNLIIENKNSFNDILEQTVKYFSKKLDCISILGVDEVSFIINDWKKLKEFIPLRKYRSHDLVSIFSQHFYKYFNDRYSNGPVYWHCKCSNIPKEKLKSYIKFRSLTILELNLTYYLKRKNFKNAGNINLSEKKQKCEEFSDYKEFKKIENGKLYISDQKIDIESFLNDKIVKLPETIREENPKFIDITNL